MVEKGLLLYCLGLRVGKSSVRWNLALSMSDVLSPAHAHR